GLARPLYRLGNAEPLTCIKIIPPSHSRAACRGVLRTPRKPPQIGARTARRYSYPTFAERPHKSRDSRLKIGHG
ncbi:MAG: hypothetical protein K2H90_00875, partial [Oscillospiraceae bacterium]|nr:hypothetical protein [Oscillospiraceae bacterium]